MLRQDTQENKVSSSTLGELASNTRLDTPNTTPTTTNKYPKVTDNNSLQRINPNQEIKGILHFHSDWLTVNFEGLTENRFQELINLLGRGLVTLEKGKSFSQGERAKNYQNTVHSPIGFKGAYNSYESENGTNTLSDLTISLAGEYFASLSAIQQWELYRCLHYDYSASCSRIDTSIDDYSFRVIPLNEMTGAYRSGDYFGFQSYHHETDETNPDDPTTTRYFGAKGAKKLVRVYQHKNESLRLETQFRGKHAQVAFEAIATLKRDGESDDEWSRIIQKNIGGIAVGTIDFRGRSHLKNPRKADKGKTKRLTFWQEFIDLIGEPRLIRIPVAKSDMSSHQKSFDWLEKYASKTLAKAFHILGKDRFINYVMKLVKHGESKLTPQDKEQIKYLRDNRDYLNLD